MLKEIEDETLPLGRASELLNRDTERLKQEINKDKIEPPLGGDQFEHVGPKICVKTTRLGLTSSYVALINQLKRETKDYYVDEIRYVHLQDLDEHFWGDYGHHKLTVRGL